MPISAEMSSAAKVALRLLKENRFNDLLAYSSEEGRMFLNEIIYSGEDTFYSTPAGKSIASWMGSIENHFIMADRVSDLYINIQYNVYTDPVTKSKFNCIIQLQTNILKPPVKYLFHRIILDEQLLCDSNKMKVNDTPTSYSSLASIGLGPVTPSISNPSSQNNFPQEYGSINTTRSSLLYTSKTPNLSSASMRDDIAEEYLTKPHSRLSINLQHLQTSFTPLTNGSSASPRRKFNPFSSSSSPSDFTHLKSLIAKQNHLGEASTNKNNDRPQSIRTEVVDEDENDYYNQYPGGEKAKHKVKVTEEEEEEAKILAFTQSITASLAMARHMNIPHEKIVAILYQNVEEVKQKMNVMEESELSEELQLELMKSILNK